MVTRSRKTLLAPYRVGNETLDAMKVGSIYLIRNLQNNKVYIGQTMQPCEQRFTQHLKLLKTNKNQLISKAISKYGKDNFVLEILESEIGESELNRKEEYYIHLYDSVKTGYNLCPGGQRWRRKPTLGEDQISLVLDLYEKGNSSRAIASKVGVTHKTILGYLKSRGLVRRDKACNLPDRSSHIDPALLAELYVSQKKTQEEIALKFGVSQRTIERAVKRHGIKRI